MHIRFAHAHVKPETFDESLHIWREHVPPLLKGAKGFKQGYLSGDRTSGKVTGVFIWETEADMEALYSSSKAAEALANLDALLQPHVVSPTTREHLEMLAEI